MSQTRLRKIVSVMLVVGTVLIPAALQAASAANTATPATPRVTAIRPGDGLAVISFTEASGQTVAGYVLRIYRGQSLVRISPATPGSTAAGTIVDPCVSNTVQPTFYLKSLRGTCEFRGLSNGVTYRVSVVARNHFGLSGVRWVSVRPVASSTPAIVLAHAWSTPGAKNAARGIRLAKHARYRLKIETSAGQNPVPLATITTSATGGFATSFIVPRSLPKGHYTVLAIRQSASSHLVASARIAGPVGPSGHFAPLTGTTGASGASGPSGSGASGSNGTVGVTGVTGKTGAAGPPAAPLSVGFDSTPATLAPAGTDGQVAFFPNVINTANGPQTVTVSAQVTDDLSGVAGVQLQLRTPLVSSPAALSQSILFVTLSLASGTILNGIWQGTVTFPQNASGGVWTMNVSQVVDAAGNLAGVNPKNGAGSDAFASYVTSPVTVTNTNPNPSGVIVAGPTDPNSLSFSPTSFTTQQTSQTLTVTTGLRDAAALSELLMTLCPTSVTNANDGACITSANGTLSSGTGANSVYAFSFHIPVGSPPGPWGVYRLAWSDASGAYGEFYSPALYGNGTNGIFALPLAQTEVTNTATSGSAHQGIVIPQASSATIPMGFSPGTVDTSSSAQTVTLTLPMSVVDPGSTLQYVQVGVTNGSGLVTGYASNPTIVNGGVTVSLTMPAHAAAGTWSIDEITSSVTDPVTGGTVGVGYYTPGSGVPVLTYTFNLADLGYSTTNWSFTVAAAG